MKRNSTQTNSTEPELTGDDHRRMVEGSSNEVADKYCVGGKPHDIRPGGAYHYCNNCEHFY